MAVQLGVQRAYQPASIGEETGSPHHQEVVKVFFSRLDEVCFEALEWSANFTMLVGKCPSVLGALDQTLNFILQCILWRSETPSCPGGDELRAKCEVILTVLFCFRLASAAQCRYCLQ